MNEQGQVRYGLKNASFLLERIRREKQQTKKQHISPTNQRQQTFDNQQQISQQYRELHIAKHNNIDSNKQQKQEEDNGKQIYYSSVQKIGKRKVGIADLVIKQHLEKTLKTFKEDLAQMQQNKTNLIQSIQQIASKINSIAQIKHQNQLLELQNFKAKKQINNMLRQYHEAKLNLQKCKEKMWSNLNKKKQKIKILINSYAVQNKYVTQVQSWNEYAFTISQNKKYIPTSKQTDESVVKPVQKQQTNKKQANKQFIDKEGLLGDLKNFAKKFKMPAYSNIDSNQT